MQTASTTGQDTGERLRDLEAMLDAIVDYEIIKLDPRGHIVTWSRGAQNVKGYTAAEVLDRPVTIFYTEEDQARGLADRELQIARETGRFEFEGWRVRKGGERFWANVVLAPIRDGAGEVTGYVKVTRDVTEQREQEQRLQRQRDEIMELSTPVIEVWERVLVLPLIGTLDSARAAALTESLLTRIAEQQAEVVIIDVSGVPMVDTQVAQHLLRTVQAATLMGATSILCGIRPETAQAIVHLGIDLDQLRSRSRLREALDLAIQLVDERSRSTGEPPAADPARRRR